LALLSVIEIFGLKRNESLFIFLCISFVFFALSFLRWETGTDWDAYYSFFENSYDIANTDFEWGFSMLNHIINQWFGNYTVLLFVSGGILYFFLIKGIYRLSVFPIMSLFFLWSISFGFTLFVRQTIAISILLYSLRYIIDRDFVRFLICLLLAMMFHTTSIIFILAWWLYKLNIKTGWMIFIVLLSMALTPIFKTIFESSLGMLGGMVQKKLDGYLSGGSDDMAGLEVSLTEIMIKGALSKGLLLTVLLFFRKKISAKIEYFDGLLNIYWFGIIIYFSLIGISVVLVRFSYAFDLVQIILVPMIFKFIDNKYIRFISVFIFCLYLATRLYSAVNAYYDFYVPYKTVLFN